MVQQSQRSEDFARAVLEGEELVRRTYYRRDALWYTQGTHAYTFAYPHSLRFFGLF